MKNIDKILMRDAISGDPIYLWSDGRCGIVGMRGDNVVFHPMHYDEATNELTDPYNESDNIILATGFTAYQYSHPDDADSMQHYYEHCKEAYKATLKYKAYYDDNIFAVTHIKDEADKAETSQVLYEYIKDEMLQELVERYLCWIRNEDVQNMAAELTPFYEGREAKWSALSLSKYLFECNREPDDIAKRIKNDIDTKGFVRLKARKKLYNILSSYKRISITYEGWRIRINSHIGNG